MGIAETDDRRVPMKKVSPRARVELFGSNFRAPRARYALHLTEERDPAGHSAHLRLFTIQTSSLRRISMLEWLRKMSFLRKSQDLPSRGSHMGLVTFILDIGRAFDQNGPYESSTSDTRSRCSFTWDYVRARDSHACAGERR